MARRREKDIFNKLYCRCDKIFSKDLIRDVGKIISGYLIENLLINSIPISIENFGTFIIYSRPSRKRGIKSKSDTTDTVRFVACNSFKMALKAREHDIRKRFSNSEENDD